ncbi:hypothetical protein P9112_010719 [Eukaryota sp. TZLM1-RC]
MTHTLDIEDWIDLSRFYLFDCEYSETAERGLQCISLLCKKAPASQMLVDLVKFCSVAFHDDSDYIHRYSDLLMINNVSSIVNSMKYNYQSTINVAKRLKKRSADSHIFSRLQNDYLSYGLLYNLTYGNSSDCMDVDAFKLLLSWDFLHCRLMHPLWNLGFSDIIKNYGLHYSLKLIDEMVDIPSSLLTEFLTILKGHKTGKARIIPTSKLIGINVNTVNHKLLLFLPEFHSITLRAVLMFLGLCSFCIDLCTFKVVLHWDRGFSVGKVVDIFEMFHPEFIEDEHFYDLLYGHLACNLKAVNK